MSKEVVYCGDIVNAASIIDIFTGNSMFHVATPYFKVEGIKPTDPKTFLEPAYTSKYGVILNQVKIYVKTMPTRPFTERFTIAWTRGRGIKKEYYVMKPYETDAVGTNVRQKIIITPRGEFNEDDAKLCMFDNQMAMIMDILLIAKILDINLSTYADIKDNSKFFVKFITEMTTNINKHLDSDSQLGKDELKLKKSYIDSFANPPAFISKDKKYIPLEQLGKPKSVIESLWKIFYDVYSNYDLESKLPKWKGIISENAAAMPAFRFIDYVNANGGNHERRFDSRITIMLKLSENDKGFNPKIKDFLLTQRCNAQKKFEHITAQNMPTLWGSTPEDPKATKGCVQTGCIFLVPQLEFKYFKQGRPTLEWRAEQIAVMRAAGAMAGGGYDDAMAFMDGVDEGEGGNTADQFNDNDNEIPI